MLDGFLPEHGGEAGSTILLFWGTFWPIVGLILLMGAVVLILTTNIGFRRALQVSAAGFLGYLAFHSLTWLLSGNGPRTEPNTYFNDRIQGLGIGLGAFVLFVALLVTMHIVERRAQQVPEE